MYSIKIKTAFDGDGIHVTGAPTDAIRIALSDMSVEFSELDWYGTMDINTFVVDKVINTRTGQTLTEQDLFEMYYHAFCPGCIYIN